MKKKHIIQRRGMETRDAFDPGKIAGFRHSLPTDIDFRQTEEEEEKQLVGYAAVFDRAADIYGFKEFVRKGAFKKSINSNREDILALYDHDFGRLLGRQSSGTLDLMEDKTGLRVAIDAPNTATGQEVTELIRRGDLKGMSFGFTVRKDTWTQDEKGNITREIHDVRLYEVSPVSMPAYTQTSIKLRDFFAPDLDADTQALLRTILKLQKGMELKEAELELLKQVGLGLNEEETDENETDSGVPVTVTDRGRRLALLEAELECEASELD